MSRPATFLLVLTLATAAACAGQPEPEPPEVAALEWQEACTLEHTRVAPPLERMPAYLFDHWGLPRSADPAEWDGSAIALLGRAYEQGLLTRTPDPREAARLYCLALRRHGEVAGAAFLAGLHARGRGVAFDARLARHFARVAALVWNPEDWTALVSPLGPATTPGDDTIATQLRAANRWLERMAEADGRRLSDLARRYRAGDGRPVSHKLADWSLEKAAWQSPDAAFRYARHQLERFAANPEAHPIIKRLALIRLTNAARRDEHPRAQRYLGHMLLEGGMVPRNPPMALIWLDAARSNGERIAVDLDALRRSLSPDEAREAAEYMDRGRLPGFLDTFPELFRPKTLE